MNTKVTNKEAKELLSGVITVLDMKPEDDIISIDDILNKVKTDLEASEKWENRINPYDEICDKNDPRTKLAIVGIDAWGNWQRIDKEGHAFSIGTDYIQHWKKTGKSYPELTNILEQLKGDKE